MDWLYGKGAAPNWYTGRGAVFDRYMPKRLRDPDPKDGLVQLWKLVPILVVLAIIVV